MQFPMVGKISPRLNLAAAMEALWLFAIFMVPIVIAPQDSMVFHYQLPKVVLLRGIVSLMAALWLLRWLSTPGSPAAGYLTDVNLGWRAFRGWVAAQPVRLLAVGVLVFVGVNILSAIFSVSPGVSTWGGFGAPDGYGLHNVAMFIILFVVIARNLSTRTQVWRLLSAIAASGGVVALIGVLQRIDVISAGAPLGGGVGSTIGDPVALGAYLVLTIPITIGLAVTRMSKSFSFGEQVLWSLLISIQMLALIFTLSVGGIVGTIIGLSTLIVFSYFAVQQAGTIKVAAVTTIAVFLTVLALSFVPDLPAPAEVESLDRQFDEREFLGISPEPGDGVLSQRAGIWATSADLIVSRPSLPSQSELLPGLRFLLGYGPDTFSYVFPLKATGDVGLRHDAQNAFIHRTVELGVLGGAAMIALYLLAFLVVVWLFVRHKDGITPDLKMVLMVLTAGLAGRLAQQMLDVGSASETMIFWTYLALIPAALRAWPVPSEPQSFAFQDGPVPRSRPLHLQGASVALVILLVAAMGWLLSDRGINVVRADTAAARALQVETTEQNRVEGLALFDEAIQLAPRLPNYYRMRGDFLVAVNENVPPGLESNADLEEIYVDRAMALKADPLSGESLLDMANITFDLTRAGYEGLDEEAEEQYRELMALSPNFSESHALLWTLLAVAYMDVGKMERSLDFLDSALAVNSSDFTRSKALFVQGVALTELGRLDFAIESLSRILEIGADNQITIQTHKQLATAYSAAGEPQLASDHYEQFRQMRDADQG